MRIIRFFSKIIRQYPKICLFVSLCFCCFFALNIYYHVTPLPSNKWIHSNLEKIQVKNNEDFSFAIFGSDRVGRHIFRDILEQADHDPEIAFAFNLGDAIFKLKKPYYQYFIKEIEAKLGIPLLTVMNDNALSVNGKNLYQKIFGPAYYSFRIGKNCFIVIDNAGQNRFEKEQTEWLINELKGSTDCDSRIILMHRPFSEQNVDIEGHYMSEELSSKLLTLFLKYNVSHIFASRENVFYEGNLKGIPYTVTGGSGIQYHNPHRNQGPFHFLKVNIKKGDITVERKEDFAPRLYKTKHHRYRSVIFAEHIIRVHWLELSLITVILLICLIYFLIEKRIKK